MLYYKNIIFYSTNCCLQATHMNKLLTIILSLTFHYSLCQYCEPDFNYHSTKINYFEFNSLLNMWSGSQVGNISVYDESQYTTYVTIGMEYFMQIAHESPSGSNWRYTAWIDYNGNESFESSEIILDYGAGYTASTYVYIPSDSSIIGLKKLRIMTAYSSTTLSPCGSYNDGEAEEYYIHITDSIVKPCYCTPIYYNGTGTVIEDFRLNEINNCNSSYIPDSFYIVYADSVFTTDLELGETYRIYISKGANAGISVGYVAWIDLNNDYKFSSSEIIANSGYNGIHIYDDYFTVSNNTGFIGNHRLRVRMTRMYSSPSPCLMWDTGETEDYYINIIQPDSTPNENAAWERTLDLLNNQNCYNIEETYDDGYSIIAGVGNNSNQLELIKLSIDGDTLWTKEYYSTNIYYPMDIEVTHDGGFTICGYTNKIDSGFGEPFVLKLNACGIEQWERYYGNLNNYEYATHIKQITNGNYILLVKYLSLNERITLMELDSAGNIIWQNNFTHNNNSEPYELLLTSDGGYLITGITYTPMPEDSNIVWLRGMAIKIDSLGNEEWNKVICINSHTVSATYSSIEMEDKGFLISAMMVDSINWSRNLGCYRLNKYGDFIWYNDITNQETYKYYGKFIRKFNNNKYVIVASKFDECDDYNHSLSLFTIDSTALVLDSLSLDDFFLRLNSAIITRNNRLVVSGAKVYPNDWDVFIYKFTEDLEFDSLYDSNIYYDSICDLIKFLPVDIELENMRIIAYPNPTCEGINIRIDNYNLENYTVELINSAGVVSRKMKNTNSENCFIECNDLKGGIYFLRIIFNEQQIISRKVIITSN